MASITQTIFNFATQLMSSTGYTGIFVLMVLESATLPVPSEVVLPFAGFLVYRGQIAFWDAVVVATIGSLIGTSIDYAIGYFLGRAAILRYGGTIRFSERHLVTAESWFRSYGPIMVLLARFMPLIRTLVAFPAGIAKMNFVKFIVYSVVGIFVWDVALIYLGYLAGANSQTIINNLQDIFTAVGVVAVVLALAYLIFRWRRARLAASEPQTTARDRNKTGRSIADD